MPTEDAVGHILADIDDTIFSPEGGVPASVFSGLPRLSWLIKQANAGAIARFSFCTGREVSYMLGASLALETPDSWSLAESGLILCNLRTQERRYHPAFTPKVRDVFEEISRKRVPELAKKYPFLRPYTGKEVNIAIERKIKTVTLADCELVIKESLADIMDSIEISVSSVAVDISPRGVNKGTGVLWLTEIIGIPLSKILFIDDSMAGKSAADMVGYLACPANASSDFKQVVAEKGENGHRSDFDFAEGVVDSICHFTGVKVP